MRLRRPDMDPRLAKAVVLVSSLVMVLIRAPHGQRSRGIKVAKNRRGSLETALLTLAGFGFFLPLVWVATPVLAWADHPLRPASFLTGIACLVLGLWLFHRSHADLGTNWSITLEVREQHRLIPQGIYRRVRHPRYLVLLKTTSCT